MNTLLLWLSKATTSQKSELAKEADSSVASIRLAAKGYRTDGEVDLTAEFAGRIEVAAAKIGGDLPVIGREDLCKACAECPYQIACNNQ